MFPGQSRIKATIIILFSAIIAFYSCSGKTGQDVFVFDPSQDYPEFPLSLNDVAEVSYIKIGGEEEGIYIPTLWNGCLYIDDSQGLLFTEFFSIGVMEFDLEGRFLRKLGRIGRGPDEYTTTEFYVQPDEKKVGVYDKGKERFLLFNYDGTFLTGEGINARISRASYNTFQVQDGCLIVYMPHSLTVYENEGRTVHYSEKTLDLFPLKEEKAASIKDIRYEKPMIDPRDWGGGGRNIMMHGFLIPSYSGLMMATYRSDTTYVIGKDFLWEPFLINVRHNGVEEGCLYPAAETKDFLFLCQQDNSRNGEMRYFAINKKTKQAYKITADDSCPLPGPLQGKVQIRYRGFTKNKEYRFWEFQPEELKEKCYDYLPQDLKALVDQCDEDSNPILMLIKFKDVTHN